MSVLDRVSDGITKHSRVVIVVLLVSTVAIGSGATMVEQTSSLSEFQSGTSRAAQAQEYITENFSGQSDNTTSAQVILRSDNALSKESLLRQLRLQQAIRTNGTVNKTLANDSQTVGIANVIATAAVRMDRVEELKERGEKLKQKGEKLKERAERLKERAAALNESKAELEARGEKLKQKGQRLKQRSKQLNESREELKQQGKSLRKRAQKLNRSKQQLKRNATQLKEQAQKLNESRQELKQHGQKLKQQARQLNRSKQQLKRNATQLKERALELKERRQQLKQDARNLSQRAKALNQSRQQLKQRAAPLRERAQELNETRQKLKQRRAELKQRAQTLKQDKQELQQDAAELKQRAQELNESRQELKQRKQQLRERAQSINETRRELEQRAKELKRRAKELAHDRLSGTVPPEELQRRKQQLKQDRNDLANDTAALKRRVDELKADKAALARNATQIKQRAQKLNESRQELKRRRAELEQRAQKLKQDKKALKQDAARLKEQAQQLKEKLAPIQQRKQELKGKAAQLKQDKRELQQRKQELKQDAAQLKQDKQELQQRKQELKQRAQKLKEEKAQLEHRAQQLKENGQQLKQAKRELQQRKQQLKQRAQELKADKAALEQRAEKLKQKGQQLKQQADALEAKQAALKNDSEALKQRAQELQNDSEALKAAKNELEQRSTELEADREELLSEKPNLTINESINVIESKNQSEIDTVVEVVLGETKDEKQSRKGVFAFMPTDYEPGSTAANATMIIVTQSASASTAGGTASERITESQLVIQDIVTERYGAENAYVFGAGIISDEITRSMTDSLIIVGPLALLFVLLVLIIAYRDLVDIALGLFGIGLVLLWTFGFMGWADIAFSQILIAVPVLLIGLSIDYAIHVIMRHREEHGDSESVRESMNTTLGGIAVALVLVTMTAVIGFLSNLTSSVPPIRDFGIVSSVGISAALLIFGALIPAMKVEIDTFLEGSGWDRNKRAFGTGGGTLGSLLSGGATAARRAPRVVIVIALLLTVAGGIGASQVDTSFSQEDFLADEPPEWMESLPEPFKPGNYTAKSSLQYVNEHFLRRDSNAQILIRGNITGPGTLEAIERAEQNASEQDVTVVLSSGETDITSPLSVMESVAAQNETFNQTFTEADTNGDGVPDRKLDKVYDTLFEVAPDKAASVIYRSDDGTYEAMKMSVSIEGDASGSEVTEQMGAIAASIEESSESDLRAIATGQPIVFKLVQDQILRTVIVSLLVTLLVTFVFLMIVYRLLHGSALLGFVTLLPVGFSVAWILGTMYLLSIPFNVVTGLITSLTVGLGIAYSIHLSERYSLELEKESKTAWEALETTVTGTGGALLGSAATTVGGFGVLVFAILPPLRQFGIIAGLTIIYAFLASVFVLPSLLIIWTRRFGPSDAFRTSWGGFERPAASSEETPSTDDD